MSSSCGNAASRAATASGSASGSDEQQRRPGRGRRRGSPGAPRASARTRRSPRRCGRAGSRRARAPTSARNEPRPVTPAKRGGASPIARQRSNSSTARSSSPRSCATSPCSKTRSVNAGNVAEQLAGERLGAVEIAEQPADAAQPRHEDRRVAELPPRVLLAQQLEPLLEVAARLRQVVHADVLGRDVEVREGRARVALELAEQQLEVALVLAAIVDPLLEVAVVADPQRRRAEALRQVVRHRVADLLVDREREAVARPVAEEAQREVLRRRAALVLARVVGLDAASAPRATARG